MQTIKCYDCGGFGSVDYGEPDGGRETCRTCKGLKQLIINFAERPELTEHYSAIDGIAKGDRNFREADRGGHYYNAAEDAVRPDVVKIIKMPDREYDIWYDLRYQVTMKLLQQWELFASIPCLNYGDKQYNMDAMASIRSQIRYLKDGIDYLKKIDELRKSVKGD